jgi:hypothetical protein
MLFMVFPLPSLTIKAMSFGCQSKTNRAVLYAIFISLFPPTPFFDFLQQALPSQSHSSYLPASTTKKVRNSFCVDDCKFSLIPSNRFDIGVADTIGKRKTMEDAVCVVGGAISKNDDLIGVFDGHNGNDASLFASLHLPVAISNAIASGLSVSEALRVFISYLFRLFSLDCDHWVPREDHF